MFPIVCLSGSTKFKDTFLNHAAALERQGCVVLTCHSFTHADELPITKQQEALYAAIYRQQIEMCDFLMVLDVGPDGSTYIGASTASEIEHAKNLNKEIMYLSELNSIT